MGVKNIGKVLPSFLPSFLPFKEFSLLRRGMLRALIAGPTKATLDQGLFGADQTGRKEASVVPFGMFQRQYPQKLLVTHIHLHRRRYTQPILHMTTQAFRAWR